MYISINILNQLIKICVHVFYTFQLQMEFEKKVKDEIEKKNIHNLMNSQMKTLSEQFTNNIGILKWVHMFYWYIHVSTHVLLVYSCECTCIIWYIQLSTHELLVYSCEYTCIIWYIQLSTHVLLVYSIEYTYVFLVYSSEYTCNFFVYSSEYICIIGIFNWAHMYFWYIQASTHVFFL